MPLMCLKILETVFIFLNTIALLFLRILYAIFSIRFAPLPKIFGVIPNKKTNEEKLLIYGSR